MDPLTLSAIGAVALTEGVKFLYGQAGELLKRWRERRDKAAEPTPVETPDVLAGKLDPVVVDPAAMERLETDISELRRALAVYADDVDPEPIDPDDEAVVRTVDALRRSLEAVWGQQITFKGEERPPSGPIVEGTVRVDDVAGYAAAVRARLRPGGRYTGHAEAKRVERGGEVVAVDELPADRGDPGQGLREDAAREEP